MVPGRRDKSNGNESKFAVLGASSSLTQDHWSITDGIKLQALMLSLQMDEWQVAQASSLSIHQVRELLAGVLVGQTSHFYSEQIKRHAGKLLLARLSNDGGSNPR